MAELIPTKPTELTQRSSASNRLGMLSTKPVDAGTGEQLLLLMSQAQAMKPNQTLPPGTPDMYLQAWEEIAEEFGMETFQAGLWKALRRTAFFPAPNEIEVECAAIRTERRAAASRAEQARRDAAWEAHKAKCLAEPPMTPEEKVGFEARLNALRNRVEMAKRK